MFLVCLFVNHVKTTEHINMGLRPHDAKSSAVAGHVFGYENWFAGNKKN